MVGRNAGQSKYEFRPKYIAKNTQSVKYTYIKRGKSFDVRRRCDHLKAAVISYRSLERLFPHVYRISG